MGREFDFDGYLAEESDDDPSDAENLEYNEACRRYKELMSELDAL